VSFSAQISNTTYCEIAVTLVGLAQMGQITSMV
jgi:hypothetical protein